MRLLLIEDDEILTDQLVTALTHQQYVVDAVTDGKDGLEYAQSSPYDLIISDVGLPGLDGISLCRQLRNYGHKTPILLMTAKNAPEERVQALDAGADDHLTKPLDLAEMQARVRALLRRGDVSPQTILQASSLQLNPVTCQVTFADAPLKLTPKEYGLLELFMRNPERVFSRSHIVEHLWNFDDPPLEDSVKAHIKGLRRKLKKVGADGWIENVYGIGYRFAPPLTRPASSQESAPSSPSDAPPSIPTQPLAESTTQLSSSASPEPEALQQAFQTSMAGLWGKYQGLMQDRIDALTTAATTIDAGTLSPSQHVDASRAAHKLAGVLGMFEQDEGSDLARQIENLLENDEHLQVPPLVQQLVKLIQQPLPSAAPTSAPEEQHIWIVTTDAHLAETLQARGSTVGMTWETYSTLSEAATALQTSLPEVAVIDIAAASMWEPSLALIRELAQQSPPVPTVALASGDSIMDRVAIARAGVQRLLIKPITDHQIWTVATPLRRRRATAQLLAVDDDPLVLKALRSLLEPWGIAVTGLDNPQQFWQVLTATQPDLLILDVAMPDFTGIELCQAVRTDPRWQDLPVFFLTAHQDADTVQQILRAGADDYLTKPIVGPELLTRILNRLERRQSLQNRVQRDRMTGLTNYTHAQRPLNQLLQTALGQSQAACLALFRLTDFASFYPRYGREGCHTILQTWGQCFQAHLPDIDTVAYWENGEFVVGLSSFTPVEAQTYLEPLQRALRQQIVSLPGGERLQPYFDVAIAACPDHGQTLPTLYQHLVAQLTSD